MNIPKVINSQKLYDLYEQIFDYFSLTVYDLESKIDTNLNISNIKNKLETFSDKHFKNALNDFNKEVKKLKNHIPEDFLKIEQISLEIKQSYNKFIEQNLFDYDSLEILKNKLKSNIDKIHKIYS